MVYERFADAFCRASEQAGKEQYLIPYFITGHPGSTLLDTVGLALYLKRSNLRPRQVQDFIPTPMSMATSMYYTGLDPFTQEPVYTAHELREKRLMKALLFYWDPKQQPLALVMTRRDGSRREIPVLCRIDTPIEVDYYRHGGILPFVLRELVGRA